MHRPIYLNVWRCDCAPCVFVTVRLLNKMSLPLSVSGRESPGWELFNCRGSRSINQGEGQTSPVKRVRPQERNSSSNMAASLLRIGRLGVLKVTPCTFSNLSRSEARNTGQIT